MKLTNAQIETLRTRPQYTRLYLSVFQPRTVMQCRVNDSTITKGARTILYNNVTLGSFRDVEAGMTLLIGTSLGASDIGRLRIRSVDANQFIVSENSNINWSNQLYLTVLRYWEVWPIFPRIIQDPANQLNVIFYKDYDIAYTNQNSVLGTFVNAGPHRMAFIDGGPAQVWYTSTGTYNLKGDSLSFDWAFEGGIPTGSTSPDPGYVSYPTGGYYVTRLTVSGSGGEIDTTYRYVIIRDRPDKGPNAPIKKWELVSLDGSRSEGGYNSATLKIYDNITIVDNAVVVIYAEDWYGNTKQSFGGNYPNASNILFVGYIEKDTIQYDYQMSFIKFNATSITGLMKNTVSFSVSTQSDANPDTWYKILDLDVRRAMYHYLKWHSTVLSVADFQFTGQDQKIQYFDADRSSLFDAIDNLMKGTLIGSLMADNQGKLWAELDAQAYTNPTGTFLPIMSISKRDWKNQPSIEERVQDETSYIEYGGIAYSGIVTGTFSALLACAPGNAPSFRGKADSPAKGLALSGQAHLNQLVGNLFANLNTRIKSVSLELTENLRNLNLAPQEVTSIHIDPQDTNKNVPLDILGIPESISWSYDPEVGLLLPNVRFTPLVSGNVGDAITIPVPSSVANGFSIPGLKIPALPIFQFAMPSGTPTGSSSGMPYIDASSASAGTNSVGYSRGAWGPVASDSSGMWVTVLYTGLYLVTGIETVNVGVLATDPGQSFIALRNLASWGMNFKSAFRPSITASAGTAYVAQYYSELTAIVYLLESQTIGIGMDASSGGNSNTRRLQVTLLALG